MDFSEKEDRLSFRVSSDPCSSHSPQASCSCPSKQLSRAVQLERFQATTFSTELKKPSKVTNGSCTEHRAPSTEQLGAIRALPYGFADLDRGVGRVDFPRHFLAELNPTYFPPNSGY